MALRSFVIGGLVVGLCSNAWASGFALNGKSASGLGHALSGTTVLAEDASTVYNNPATMRSLEGQHFSAVLHTLISDIHFDNNGSTTAGSDNEQVDKVHFVPNLYYVNALNEAFSFGLGIYSPFGLSLEYDEDWVGRYHIISTELQTVNISPAVAFSLNDKLDIGIGIDFQHAYASQEKAVDFGGTDGGLTLSGTSWAVGYTLGATYDLNQATRLGLSFHSATRHDLEGDSEFDGVPAIFSTVFTDSDASLRLTLPESLSLGVRHTVSPRLEVMADYTWTRWSRYDQLVVKFDNALPPAVEENNWKNSNHYSAGLNYRWQEGWVVRAGILYDQTPIPDAEHRSPSVPDSSKVSVALGSNLTLNDKLSLDLAVFYTLPSTMEINNTDSYGHVLKGSYDVQTTYISAQLNWKL